MSVGVSADVLPYYLFFYLQVFQVNTCGSMIMSFK